MQMRKILLLIIIFSSMSLFSLPPGWEKVDVRPWKPSSYYTEIECADSANCMIWAEYWGAGGYYFRRTTDAGKTWENVYKDSAWTNWNNDTHKYVPKIRAIAYPNDKLFIAVGDSGLIVRTTDKGESWESFRIDSNLSLFNLRMLDENYGIVASSEYPDIDSMNILETFDGGKKWIPMNYVFDGLISFWDIDIISRNQIAAIVWLRDSLGASTGKDILLMAYNNWEYCDTLDMSQQCRHIDFVEENQGWIAGGWYSLNDPTPENYTQEIQYTNDGGKTWIEQRNRPYENNKGFTISGLDMYDENFGIAKSNQAFILISTDGGKNWQENQLLPHKSKIIAVFDICAASPTTAYAILQGDTVYKYTREISNVNEDDYYMANLHPNPATSQITISFGDEFVSAPEIDIIDYLGNIHKPEYQINNKEITINTSTLSPGVYYLRIRSGSKVETRKFVVVR